MTHLTWNPSVAGDATALDALLTVTTSAAGVPTAEVDLAADPQLTERLGAALAELMAPTEPTVVLGWLGADEAVLAHVVARRLGVPAARASFELGRLLVDPAGISSARVALVATSWGRDLPLAPLQEVVGRVASVVVAAELVTTDPGAGTVWLASTRGAEERGGPGPGAAAESV